MICFLIFGWRAGFITLGGGSIILFFFDPTGIGPIFKFLATLPLMLVPFLWYEISRRKREFKGSLQQWCMPMKNYVPSMVLGWAGRVALMILCNAVIFMTLYAGFLKYATLALIGLPNVTGWEAVIWVTVLINTWQTIVDAVFPYLIAFKIVEKYGQSGAFHA
jgi:riboflavin transporter FmnP